MKDGLRWHDPSQQLALVSESVHDTRPALPTGFDSIDTLLRRGGLLPGNLVILAGRTGTRKTTVSLNMAVSLARSGVVVGYVGLDESPWLYTVKAMSVLTGVDQEELERDWDADRGASYRDEWRAFAQGRFHLFTGRRPGPEHLDPVVSLAALESQAARTQVLFLDYLSLMSRRGEFGYAENSRVPRLVEELQVWSTDHGVALVLLHQLSRNDEHGGGNSRNAGHIPVTLAQLKYGGEEMADVVLGTYRPSLNPLGNMPMHVAKEVLGDRFDEDDWYEVQSMVKREEKNTYLQLLKNRPGTATEPRGVVLVSPDLSLRMEEKTADEPERVRARSS